MKLNYVFCEYILDIHKIWLLKQWLYVIEISAIFYDKSETEDFQPFI